MHNYGQNQHRFGSALFTKHFGGVGGLLFSILIRRFILEIKLPLLLILGWDGGRRREEGGRAGGSPGEVLAMTYSE